MVDTQLVRADQRVAALNVAGQVGQGALVGAEQVPGQRVLRFAFEHLQKERELSDFDRLRVDVHAVDVVEEDALVLGGAEAPEAAGALVDFPGVLRGAVGDVPVAVPVEQVLVGAEQERAGAAGGVEDAQLGGLLGAERARSYLPPLSPGFAGERGWG